MNFELFIARHIVGRKAAKFSKPIVQVAIAAIALGLAVMLLAVAILTGFQKEIREKVVGFGSHIQITAYDENFSYETRPISSNQSFYPSLDTVDGIRHIQVFATKAGIIKSDDLIQGVVLKGVDGAYDWSFFSDKLIEGQVFSTADSIKSNQILISRYLASKLKLKCGDRVRMYFVIDNKPRGRRFDIAGIYETGLEEFDKMMVLGDIRHIQKLNKWSADQVTGFEVFIDDFSRLDQLAARVYHEIGFDLNARSIRELQPQIFDWLELQDMNVIIILVLMVMVAAITMISTLLILILERTNMIGILKALGAPDWSIRKMFLYNAAFIIARGLLWGNLAGIGLGLIQQQFGIIRLSQANYFVSKVPVLLDWEPILILNVGTLIICVAMLLIPSYIIARISPVKAIRFN